MIARLNGLSEQRDEIEEDIDSLERSRSFVGGFFSASSSSPTFASSKSHGNFGASDLWTRLKITGLNGTLGRSGVAIHGQAGLVWPTANGGSIGTFLSLFRSNTSSTTLGTNTVTTGLGAGAYYKFPLTQSLTGGISATFERSSNNIINGTATGTFARDLATIDASISTTRQRGQVTWTPSANLSYTYSNRHAYADSAATAVAGRIDQTLVASAGLNGSRTILLSGRRAKLVTITGGGGLSANLSGSSTLTFSGGQTVVNNAFSASLNGGATWQMKNGGTLGLSAAIGGIGAGVQSYTGAITYNLKF